MSSRQFYHNHVLQQVILTALLASIVIVTAKFGDRIQKDQSNVKLNDKLPDAAASSPILVTAPHPTQASSSSYFPQQGIPRAAAIIYADDDSSSIDDGTDMISEFMEVPIKKSSSNLDPQESGETTATGTNLCSSTRHLSATDDAHIDLFPATSTGKG